LQQALASAVAATGSPAAGAAAGSGLPPAPLPPQADKAPSIKPADAADAIVFDKLNAISLSSFLSVKARTIVLRSSGTPYFCRGYTNELSNSICYIG
jgi:hypothetical protein